MMKLPFVSYNMSKQQIQSVLDISEVLKKNHGVAFDPDFTCDLKCFASFENNDIVDSGPFLKITNPRGSFHLGFFQVGYKINIGRNGCSETTGFQNWGILNLQKDYGHILIKPETLLDKIHNLIHHIELDFEDDPEFNRKFYVLCEDKTKTFLYLTPPFSVAIKAITTPDFIIEILGNTLIIGNEKPTECESAEAFVEFFTRLTG
jgi:hypothetical protein